MNNGLRGITAPIGVGNLRYKPPFAKANSCPADRKLREFISVKDFDAVGNNTTDDSEAINYASTKGKRSGFPLMTACIIARLP